MREIGGRTERFGLSPSSVRFALGFGASINETVSTTGFGAGAAGAFSGFEAFSTAARDFAAGVELRARGAVFSGSAFAVGLSDAALTGLRTAAAAVGAFRAPVLDVVFVAIRCC